MKSLMGLVLFFVLFSCQGASYKDKICNKYIGKELVYFPDSDLVNEKHVQEKYRLIHTLDITCSSCLNEISDNISFINWLDEQHVAFEIIGYSSYKDSVFNPALLEYPFYFDFYRKFRTRNKLKDDNVVRTFLLTGNKIVLAGDIKDEDYKENIMNYVKSNLIK